MAKRETSITDISASWENKKGTDVENFLKNTFDSKVGFYCRSAKNTLQGFASKESYEVWKQDPVANADLLLSEVEAGGGTSAASYVLELELKSDTTIVTTDNEVKIRVLFSSSKYSPITQSTTPTGETGTMTVQTRTSADGEWQKKGVMGNVASGSEQTVDITSLITSGTQYVRIMITGDATGEQTGYATFQVTKTKLALDFASSWELPITSDYLPLSYYIQGAIAKTLHVRISGTGGTREITKSIGATSYTETPYEFNVTDLLTDAVKVTGHGLHTVEAWLSVDGSTVVCDHVKNELLIWKDTSDTSVYIIMNEVKDTIVNWTSETFFRYAVYNPVQTYASLVFSFTSYEGTTEYLRYTAERVENGVKTDFINTMEIDSEDTELYAYLHISAADKEIRRTSFRVDNTDNFAPTAGADFVMSPKSRSNSEANASSIINEVTGARVASTWTGFDFTTDAWTTDDDGSKVLRVRAGASIAIDYESYSDFMSSSATGNLTIEIDAATRNITDETEAILKMCSYGDSGNPLGFEMKPLEMCFMTKQSQVIRDQDLMFSEDTRTHFAVNIVYNLGNSGFNYIRLFVNGTINREILYASSDTFVDYVNGKKTSQGIRIGSSSADIDIYGIRVYKKALSATDIRQDRLASLPTTLEKKAYKDANDILSDNGSISYSRTYEKYNTMLWTGKLPYYLDQEAKSGGWKIHIVGDPAHSGTLGNASGSAGMKNKGQGTSSKGYFIWNQQSSFDNGSTWTDENGVNHGAYYQLDDEQPKATKLVGKINYASSQQSHKIGSTALYTDLWRKVTGGSGMTKTTGFENVRVSVKELPFFVFRRDDEASEPEFYCLMTFGAGKGDKPTFGYDKSVFPNYMMLEGCDNGRPLLECRVPWNDDLIRDDSSGDVLFMYNGEKNLELSGGSEKKTDFFKQAFNFTYLHSIMIKPYVGKLSALKVDKTLSTLYQYWVTSAEGESAQYDLYRYDFITQTWVDAGIAKIAAGKYAKLNINEQCGSVAGSSGYWDDLNKTFIAYRASAFKTGIEAYYDLKDMLFSVCFCKLVAASDNRAKNTYQYFDDGAESLGGKKIRFAQDDLDTIFLTDNVGRKTKPYYVEEHDKDSTGNGYWNGESNAFYNLIDAAFEVEIQDAMNDMLSKMSQLSGSVEACMDQYYFAVQKYFPTVAYNENARLLYETAQKYYGTQYMPSTPPIAQSLGDQLEAEKMWIKRRLIYLSSYSSYGNFAASNNVQGGLTFRSLQTTAGVNPKYEFTLTPKMWLYPSVSTGTTNNFGTAGKPQRVTAGNTYTLGNVHSDGNTNVIIHGIDQFTDIGEFGDKSLGEVFPISGDALTSFSASSLKSNTMEFRPSSVSVTAKNLRKLSLYGVSTILGGLDLTACKVLQQADLRGTKINTIGVSTCKVLEKLMLPATLTQLKLASMKKLTSVSLTGTESLTVLAVEDSPGVDSLSIVRTAITSGKMGELTLTGIEWADVVPSILISIASMTKVTLTGQITLTSAVGDTLTAERKQLLMEKFGNIDSNRNALKVIYTSMYKAINETNTGIEANSNYSEVGTYTARVKIMPTEANNFTAIRWSLEGAEEYATVDATTGKITVKAIGSSAASTRATLRATISRVTQAGAAMADTVKTLEVTFFFRALEIGDYIFEDGTFAESKTSSKTVVGVCYYLKGSDRRMVSVERQTVNRRGFYGLYNKFGLTEFPTVEGIGNKYENIETSDYWMPDSVPSIGAFTDFKGKTNTAAAIAYSDAKIKEKYEGTEDYDNYFADLSTRAKIDAAVQKESPQDQNYSIVGQLWRVAAIYAPSSANLKAEYVKGNWYLPAAGEMKRIAYYIDNKIKGFTSLPLVTSSTSYLTSTVSDKYQMQDFSLKVDQWGTNLYSSNSGTYFFPCCNF